MLHRIEPEIDEPKCSRCGRTVYDENEECPAVSDGEIYARGKLLGDKEMREILAKKFRDIGMVSVAHDIVTDAPCGRKIHGATLAAMREVEQLSRNR